MMVPVIVLVEVFQDFLVLRAQEGVDVLLVEEFFLEGPHSIGKDDVLLYFGRLGELGLE